MIGRETSEVLERSEEGREDGLFERDRESTEASVSHRSSFSLPSSPFLRIERAHESNLPLESIDGKIFDVATLSNDDRQHGSIEGGHANGEGLESREVC